MNKINVFSVEMLKQRFLVGKTEDKKFIYKIRQANEELKKLGLISGFVEEKDGRKTTAFKVEYSYAKLYKKKKDLSGFEDKTAFDIQPKIEDQPTVEDEEFFDDSYLKN